MERDGRTTNSFCRHIIRSFCHPNCSRDLIAHQSAFGFNKRLSSPSDSQYQAAEVPENSDNRGCNYDILSSSKRIGDTAKYLSITNFLTPNYLKHEFGNSQKHLRLDHDMSKISLTGTNLIRDNQSKETFEKGNDFFQGPSFKNEKTSRSELRTTKESPPCVGCELHGNSHRKVFDLYETKKSFNPCKDFDLHTCPKDTRSNIDFNCHGDRRKILEDEGKIQSKYIFDTSVKEKDLNTQVAEKNFVHDCLADTSLKFRIQEEEAKRLTQSKYGVTVTLLNSALWRAFNEIGTEMIINRGGRRMFPFLALSVEGLEPECYYNVNVQIIPAATRRFKYINMKWIPVGLADTEAIQMPYIHSDSPNTGAFWNNSKITFSKIKLTNNLDCASQNILLHSMHKYRIVTTFTPLDDSPDAKTSLTFSFTETDFMAVTAYQNEAVTQMKIHNNPFAKAFRDANFSSMRRNITQRKRKHPIQSTETVKVHGDIQAPVFSDTKPSCNPLTSFSEARLQAYPSKDYTFGNTGFQLTQTPSLLGIRNLSYCLPWGSFPIIPSALCSSLFPYPAFQNGSCLPAGEEFLTTECDAASRIPLQVKRLESSSTSDIEKV